MKTLQEQILQQGADTNVDDITLKQISEIENEVQFLWSFLELHCNSACF